MHEAVKDRYDPNCWRVEFIDHASEGECYLAVFIGFAAEARAKEYAVWKNSRSAVTES